MSSKKVKPEKVKEEKSSKKPEANKQDTKSKQDMESMAMAVIEAVREQPMIIQMSLQDTKSLEPQAIEAMNKAWMMVAGATNIPVVEAQTMWNNLVEDFTSSYNEMLAGKKEEIIQMIETSGSSSLTMAVPEMECDNCKLWGSMDFMKNELDELMLPKMEIPNVSVNFTNSESTGRIGDAFRSKFGGDSNRNNNNGRGSGSNRSTNRGRSGLSDISLVLRCMNLSLGEAIQEIESGQLTKQRFLQYLGSVLDSVPISGVAQTQRELLELAMTMAYR